MSDPRRPDLLSHLGRVLGGGSSPARFRARCVAAQADIEAVAGDELDLASSAGHRLAEDAGGHADDDALVAAVRTDVTARVASEPAGVPQRAPCIA